MRKAGLIALLLGACATRVDVDVKHPAEVQSPDAAADERPAPKK